MDIPTSDGGHIWAEVVGVGDPLVLLSGMSQDHGAWAANARLAEHFRLVFVDNRGTGQSSDFPAASDYEPTTGLMADDVLAVLDYLDIPRAHVMGHSMGGRIAQWVAIRFPRRVGDLILLSTSCGERHGVARSADADRKLAGANQVELALLNYNAKWLGSHGPLAGEIHRSLTERSSQRNAHLQATHGHDSWGSLPRIKAPTLIVHGADDQINPVANAAILAERIPNSETMIIPGGRHNVAAEYADDVNARVVDFCRRHPLED